jgi:hypothetical protein
MRERTLTGRLAGAKDRGWPLTETEKREDSAKGRHHDDERDGGEGERNGEES